MIFVMKDISIEITFDNLQINTSWLEINTFKFDNFVIAICDYSFAPISLKLYMRNEK